MSETEPEPAPVIAWTALSAAAKRQRVLDVAGELFAREGVEFPMPLLAKEVGVGVGSVYRQVGTKDDVLAFLVIERLRLFGDSFERAAGSDDPTAALLRVVEDTLERVMEDRIAKISFELATERDDVREVRKQAAEALEHLVEEAKRAGGVRQDASAMDLRIMFRLAREAEKITPGGGRRIAELVMAGLLAT